MATTEEQRLVERHLGLVRTQASEIMRSTGLPDLIELEDLVSFGTAGLIEASRRFDPARGRAFSTFAYYRVRGAIFDGIRSYGWLNRRDYARLRERERVDAYLQSCSERAPAAPSGSLEDSVAALADALDGAAAVFVTSLAAEEPAEEADPSPAPDEALATGRLDRTVRDAMSALLPNERAVIEAFYYKDQNLKDAGRDLGLSKSWASRLHASAIDKLRLRLRRAPVVREAVAKPARAAGPARGRPAARRP